MKVCYVLLLGVCLYLNLKGQQIGVSYAIGPTFTNDFDLSYIKDNRINGLAPDTESSFAQHFQLYYKHQTANNFSYSIGLQYSSFHQRNKLTINRDVGFTWRELSYDSNHEISYLGPYISLEYSLWKKDKHSIGLSLGLMGGWMLYNQVDVNKGEQSVLTGTSESSIRFRYSQIGDAEFLNNSLWGGQFGISYCYELHPKINLATAVSIHYYRTELDFFNDFYREGRVPEVFDVSKLWVSAQWFQTSIQLQLNYKL